MKILALAVCLLTATHVSPGQFSSRKLDNSLLSKRSAEQPIGKSSRNTPAVVSGRPDSADGFLSSTFSDSLTTVPIESALDFTIKLDNPSPAAGDECGARVAVSGTTAVVTCHLDDVTFTNQGSAYVYVKSGGTWTQQAMLTASDAAAGDQFGFSVAIDGDTIVIGSVIDDGAFADQGSAYVFVRSGTVWTQEAKLTASDPAVNDRLGWRVDVSGNTVVAGAPYDDGSVTEQGSAYIFTRSGGVWTQQAKLTNPAPVINDFFAASVAIDGDTIVLGGDGDDVTFGDQGSAYVFVRSGAVWTQQAFLTASDGALQDYFGISVDISADTIVVGAMQDDGTVTDQGSAYVYVRSGSSWSQQAKLTATGSDPTAGDLFGWMVSIVGDRVAVSAIYDNVTLVDQGAVYLFLRTGSSWNYIDRFTASDASAGDSLGTGLGLSPNALIAGAFSDDGAFTNQGSAYIYELAPSAADVSIAGRVTTASGRAISRVSVSLTDTNGSVRYAITNAFGYYSFDDVKAGSYYILDARHRSYQFDSTFLSVSDDLTNVNLIPRN